MYMKKVWALISWLHQMPANWIYTAFKYNFEISDVHNVLIKSKGISELVSNISYLPKRPRQTEQTQIRLLPKKQSD